MEESTSKQLNEVCREHVAGLEPQRLTRALFCEPDSRLFFEMSSKMIPWEEALIFHIFTNAPLFFLIGSAGVFQEEF